MQVALDAGLSRQQVYQAAAVAAIPEDEFERLVDSDNPSSITELARIGKRQPKRPAARRLRRCPHCGGDLTVEEAG